MDNSKEKDGAASKATAQSRLRYWSAFYDAKTADHHMQPPSQFAAFVASEIGRDQLVFDIGCGSGRDSVFFAELGHDVIALDGCKDAIKVAQTQAELRGLENIKFLANIITGDALKAALNNSSHRRKCVYARFFLHAITQDEQDNLFKTLASNLSPGDMLAFEFRTTKDEALQKVAPPHYRRYQSASAVNGALTSSGFRLLYGVEGQGFAKYKTEDAIVARCLFERA